MIARQTVSKFLAAGRTPYNCRTASDMKPTRRDVLKAGAIAAGSLALGGFSGAFSRGLQKRPVIGSGEHTYEVYHDWLQPPANLQWGDTHGLVQDSNGMIYVAHTVNGASVSKDAVVIFDEEG